MLVVTRPLYPALWRRRCSSCINLQTGEGYGGLRVKRPTPPLNCTRLLHVLFPVDSSDEALPAGTQARAFITYSPTRRQRLSNTAAFDPRQRAHAGLCLSCRLR
jgi:hypothetical protein